MRRTVSILFSLFLACGTYASTNDLGIPHSSATVDVRVFNVANVTLVGLAHTLIAPILPGHENSLSPVYAFLVEHKNLGNVVAGFFTSGMAKVEQVKDITELLQDGGIPLATIDTVIWSHTHFDHIGDLSKFPNTTGLVIGSETDTSTYPEFANASLQASDLAGRDVKKIDFSTANHTFSGLKAVDYFGDGSFYLLNTPGHTHGHLAALARVTPTSFVALGGDTFHHVGEARPRPRFQQNFPCPADLLEEAKSSISTDYFWSPHSRDGAFDLRSRAAQLFTGSDLPDSFNTDPVAFQVSLDKLATFDADPDVFVLVAHDLSVRESLPYFPAYLNGWQASGLKERTVWNFVKKTNAASFFTPVNATT
ncbi:beta-lactamase-like protein [Mycena olivaceomarginata]|nr:beta-lactamase-like protein [Mycena olivaceomarginata]